MNNIYNIGVLTVNMEFMLRGLETGGKTSLFIDMNIKYHYKFYS